MKVLRPLKNFRYCFISRQSKILATRIHEVWGFILLLRGGVLNAEMG